MAYKTIGELDASYHKLLNVRSINYRTHCTENLGEPGKSYTRGRMDSLKTALETRGRQLSDIQQFFFNIEYSILLNL